VIDAHLGRGGHRLDDHRRRTLAQEVVDELELVRENDWIE
jgi:hypothetical protein